MLFRSVSQSRYQNVRKSFDEKQHQFNEMQLAMSKATNRNINKQLKLTKMEVSKEYVSDKCKIKLGDSVQLIKEIPDESVGFLFSHLLLRSFTLILISWRIWAIQRIIKSFSTLSISW